MCFTLSSRAGKADKRPHMHTFSQEHFVGPELFQKLSADDICTDDRGHKLSAEKRTL